MRTAIILLLAVVTACCSDPKIDERHARAESMMESAPDSALTLLNTIDAPNLRGQQAAHHALLLSHAHYRNYIIDTDDSLINIAVDYYTSHPDTKKLMTAYYCQGRVLDNSGRYPEAMTAALRTLDLATSLDDAYYKARAHELMGDLWSASRIYGRATESYQKAAVFYESANRPDNKKWAIADAAVSMSNDGNTQKALALYDSLNSANEGDSLFICNNLGNMARIHFQNHEYATAKDQFSHLANSKFYDNSAAYVYLSLIHSVEGNAGYAAYALEKVRESLSYSTDPQTIIAITEAEAALNWISGDFGKSFWLHDKAYKSNDSIMMSALTNNVAVAESEFYKSKHVVSASKASKRGKLALIMTIGLILAATLCLWFKHQLKMKDKQIADKMKTYLHLSELYSSLLITSEHQKSIISDQNEELSGFKNKFSEPATDKSFDQDMSMRAELIKRLYDIFLTYGADSHKMKEKTFKFVQNLIGEMSNNKFIFKLAEWVDGKTSGLATWYFETFKNMKELSVLVYSVYGLSAKEISLALGIKLQTIYSIRSKVRNRILTSDLANKDELSKLVR